VRVVPRSRLLGRAIGVGATPHLPSPRKGGARVHSVDPHTTPLQHRHDRLHLRLGRRPGADQALRAVGESVDVPARLAHPPRAAASIRTKTPLVSTGCRIAKGWAAASRWAMALAWRARRRRRRSPACRSRGPRRSGPWTASGRPVPAARRTGGPEPCRTGRWPRWRHARLGPPITRMSTPDALSAATSKPAAAAAASLAPSRCTPRPGWTAFAAPVRARTCSRL